MSCRAVNTSDSCRVVWLVHLAIECAETTGERVEATAVAVGKHHSITINSAITISESETVAIPSVIANAIGVFCDTRINASTCALLAELLSGAYGQ